MATWRSLEIDLKAMPSLSNWPVKLCFDLIYLHIPCYNIHRRLWERYEW